MIDNILEFISLVSVGIVSGATFYSSIVEIPIRSKTAEEDQLNNWKLVFPKASSLLKTFGNISMLSLLVTWYLTNNIYWLIASIPLMILIPFTAIFIAKTNSIIMSKNNPKGITALIKQWGKLHHIRTALAIISFMICSFTVIFK